MGVERLFKSFLAAMGASILMAGDFCGLGEGGQVLRPQRSTEPHAGSRFRRIICIEKWVILPYCYTGENDGGIGRREVASSDGTNRAEDT